ncbi:MAG: alanyl-tRNA editing protein [Rhodobacter sp.]|jgi:misacylated tRNA(Ala) deacylase|nr:alanyl-tRNA editing protein [Rhodobacter sp.]
MTRPLFRTEPYTRESGATVTAITETGGVVLDGSIFYPQGGGQPGDTGWLCWGDCEVSVTNAIKGAGDAVVLVIEDGAPLPDTGQIVTQRLDWERRYRHMRVHTGLHLLSVVIPLPVTGGAITALKGRLDFDMPEAPEDKEAIEAELNALIARDLPISESWITDAELDANPGLVKTMSVQPPRGAGRVRLIRIGDGAAQVDLQPCGGTHVARTSEIGAVTLGKVEKKGARNRRVNMLLA